MTTRVRQINVGLAYDFLSLPVANRFENGILAAIAV